MRHTVKQQLFFFFTFSINNKNDTLLFHYKQTQTERRANSFLEANRNG